ncbi:MAG: LacI family transcriptional regulator [Spirochaetaceae bacterium]|jgi:LacI family transcriptional regulator|nr:LacI family transcriptional regulator [Spirochaetaceae bacterium]
MVNIIDIAKQVGVSPSTVSRVVNGKGYVKLKKREEILKIIDETGYIPNKAARNMSRGRSFAIGIVIPDTFNIFQRQLFSVIERNVDSFGYHTLFFFVKPEGVSEKACLNHMKSEKLDGVILLHELKDTLFYEYCADIKLPVISTICNHRHIPTVTIDDRQAAKEGVNHLIGLGHTKIAMICAGGFSFGNRRVEGYYEALEENGLPRDERRLVYVPQYTAESGMYGMRELLLRSRDFSAVFAASDELALGAMRSLRDEDLRIPEDVSLIGFDDIDIADYLHPRLTTIRQPIREIGEQAARYLHRVITAQQGTEAEVVLPHRLIIRDSTCTPVDKTAQ